MFDKVQGLPGVKASYDDINQISTPWSYSPDDGDSDRELGTGRGCREIEFGHCRISASGGGGCPPPSFLGFDIGGHCVVPPEILEVVLNSGWGIPHPLAGRFHPILEKELPESLIFFRAPRDEDDLEVIWSQIVLPSYQCVVRSLSSQA